MPRPPMRNKAPNRTGLRHTLFRAGAVSVALVSLQLVGCAAPSSMTNASNASGSSSSRLPPAVALHPNPAYASLPRYEGALGKRAIVLHLGEKTGPDDAGGLHGEYQFQDNGQVILVAGDGDNGVVELDESDDGTRISGQWVGKLNADGTFKGVWSNVDESVTESIELHRVPANAVSK